MLKSFKAASIGAIAAAGLAFYVANVTLSQKLDECRESTMSAGVECGEELQDMQVKSLWGIGLVTLLGAGIGAGMSRRNRAPEPAP